MTVNRKFFYGWIIAAVCALGNAFGISAYIPATLGLLLAPWQRDLGWSAPQIYLAINVATLACVMVAPCIGALIDRCGARRVIVVSFVAEALLIYSFRYLDNDIRWFYARYAALALLGTGTTAIAFSALISRWFDRRRGLALGITLGGFGVGGVFWSLLTQWLIEHIGWRNAFPYLGGIIAGIVLPIMLFALRDTPAALGLTVDGKITAAHSHPPNQALTGMTLRAAASSGQYWLIAVTFFLIGSVVYGLLLHLAPLLQKQGSSAQFAATVQASIWAALVCGRVATGWLLDRCFAPRVALAFLLACMLGIGMLLLRVNPPAVFVAAMLIGLAIGAEVDVLAYLTSRYFGLRHFGAIYASYFAIYAIGTGLGPVTMAWSVSRNGEYAPALWCSIGILCMAGLLLLRFKSYAHARVAY